MKNIKNFVLSLYLAYCAFLVLIRSGLDTVLSWGASYFVIGIPSTFRVDGAVCQCMY